LKNILFPIWRKSIQLTPEEEEMINFIYNKMLEGQSVEEIENYINLNYSEESIAKVNAAFSYINDLMEEI
jgi:hypothetical protein